MTNGASGALPTEQIWTEERSASSKRGWSRIRWVMAGTRKTATGRSFSTVSSQRPASKRGM